MSQLSINTLILILGIFSLIYMVIQLTMKMEETNRTLNKIVKHLNLDTSEMLDEELKELIKQGKKVEAIKLYREKTGKSLKESSNHVESLSL